ncbi:MAG: RNA polymerase sigma factor [Planctomycetota bacterium]|nr:MAG: RNA polymerase sigma factor [Planctomycetota bacterium]
MERELDGLGDEELLARCRTTRSAEEIRLAISIIARRHHAPLIRYLESYVGEHQTAQDLAQEAFVRLYRHARRYQAEKAQVRTWLYRIATNLALNAIRDRRRKPALSLDRPLGEAEGASLGARLADRAAPEPSGAALRGELVERVRAAVAELAEPYRSALLLCDLEGLSYQEAAAALEVPIGTIRSRLFRARMQLQQRLAPLLERGAL